MCGPRGSCSKTLSAWSMQKLGISTCTQKHCSSSLSTRSMFEQRQCKLQSKLRYLLSGRKSVVDMKPLQTLHGKRVRDPLWFLIGNIATCLGNAPHPGMAASANYIEWLECLSSCCFEYEQGLTILCQWFLHNVNVLASENIFACIRNRVGHVGHATNIR